MVLLFGLLIWMREGSNDAFNSLMREGLKNASVTSLHSPKFSVMNPSYQITIIKSSSLFSHLVM